jgi:uncharacterized protein (DUF362 family)
MGSASEIGGMISRRDFNQRISSAAATFALRKHFSPDDGKSLVALVKNRDRQAALSTAFALAAPVGFENRQLYLKGNFTSPDSFPATTHPDTLRGVVAHLRALGCGKITLVERSTFGTTARIWEILGIPSLAKELGVALLPLDELPASRWRRKALPGSHWKRGIEIPDFLETGEPLIQICTIKTHRFGGHFSASLKNSIGLIAKHASENPSHNYMEELHESLDQRQMIAEVNQAYIPALVVMDAMQVMTAGGPDRGETAAPEVVGVSTDRVAIDAMGVILLRLNGAGPPISRGAVFQFDQLKRAGELKIGAATADQIEFLTSDPDSSALAAQIKGLLSETDNEKDKTRKAEPLATFRRKATVSMGRPDS